MKTLRLLAISLLLVALCAGFSSCGDDELDTVPPTQNTDDNLFDKTNKYFAEYLKDYSNITCRGYSAGESTVLLSGIKNKHLWFSEFDASTKSLKSEWTDIKETDTIQKIYKGYGEYETLYIRTILPIYYKKTSTGNIVAFMFNSSGRSQTIFTYNNKSKRTQFGYNLTPNDWYSESVFIGDCCYSNEGDTIYVTKESPLFENGKVDAKLISYEEGIRLGSNSISKYNYKEAKSIWVTYITPPFDITSDAKRSYTLLNNSTNVWEYKCEVTFYDGNKKDFTFKINIEDGKATDEIKVTGISINKNTVNLKQGETFQLAATVQPNNATNKKVTWSSSNEAIASISKEGLVTALSSGETNITVTTEDGSFSTTAIVTVTSNEEENKATLASLKGTWDMLKCYGWEYNDQNIKENWEESVAGEYIFFTDVNGNGGYNNGYQTYSFIASIEGNKLIIRNSEWLKNKSITITKLTSTELYIKAVDADSEENYEIKKRSSEVTTSSIIGTWVGGEIGYNFNEILTFNPNGKGSWDKDAFTYTLNSNKAVIDYGDGDPETWTFSVSGTTLNMTAEDGVKYIFTKK